MSKNEIIEEFYNDRKFLEALDKITSNHELKDDLKHMLMEALLKMDETRIQSLWKKNQLLFLSIRILKNQYHSKTSKFHKQWRKYNKHESIDNHYDITAEKPDIEEKEIIEKIERILNTKIHWFDAHIFRCYYMNQITEDGDILKPMSYKKIMKLHQYDDMTISINTIMYSVKDTLQKIKEELC